MALIDELLELERGFWASSGTTEFYETHMSDNGLCVFSFGHLDKEATKAGIASSAPWTTFEFHDVQVHELDHNAATISYRAEADREGEPYRAMVTSVYSRATGSWKLMVHQQTELAGL
jgi:hypothetical protein